LAFIVRVQTVPLAIGNHGCGGLSLGPNHRAAFSTAPLSRVRRSTALGQAVEIGRYVGQAAGADKSAASGGARCV